MSHNDRIILVQLQTMHRYMNITKIYAPTSDKTYEDVEKFYGDLKEVINLEERCVINMVIGNFNSKVGTTTGNSIAWVRGLSAEIDLYKSLLNRLLTLVICSHLVILNILIISEFSWKLCNFLL